MASVNMAVARGSRLIDIKVKEAFFDSEKVIKAVGKARAAGMRKAGAYIRTNARQRLRRRRRASEPGYAPSIHVGSGGQSLKQILFYFDGKDGMICGPVGGGDGNNGKTVPELMEYGGTAQVEEQLLPQAVAQERYPDLAKQAHRIEGKGAWVPAGRRSRARQRRIRTVSIEPRPFMGPALQEESPKFSGLWDIS